MRFFYLSFLFILPLFSSPLPFFIPPSTWHVADQSKSSHPSLVAFISDKETPPITPTLSLSTCPYQGDKEAWMKEAIAIHNKDHNKECLSLGPLSTAGGEAHFLQINQKFPFGTVSTLQLLFFDATTVYILSSPLMQSSLPHLYPTLLTAFKTFKVVPSFFDLLSPAQKEQFQKLSSPADIKTALLALKAELGSYFVLLGAQELIK